MVEGLGYLLTFSNQKTTAVTLKSKQLNKETKPTSRVWCVKIEIREMVFK